MFKDYVYRVRWAAFQLDIMFLTLDIDPTTPNVGLLQTTKSLNSDNIKKICLFVSEEGMF